MEHHEQEGDGYGDPGRRAGTKQSDVFKFKDDVHCFKPQATDLVMHMAKTCTMSDINTAAKAWLNEIMMALYDSANSPPQMSAHACRNYNVARGPLVGVRIAWKIKYSG